jgi:hypothetical protein
MILPAFFTYLENSLSIKLIQITFNKHNYIFYEIIITAYTDHLVDNILTAKICFPAWVESKIPNDIYVSTLFLDIIVSLWKSNKLITIIDNTIRFNCNLYLTNANNWLTPTWLKDFIKIIDNCYDLNKEELNCA